MMDVVGVDVNIDQHNHHLSFLEIMKRTFQILFKTQAGQATKTVFHNNNIWLITYFHANLQRQKQVLPIFWKQNHFIVFFCSFLHVAETMNCMDIYIPIKSTIHPPLKRNAKVFSAKSRNIVTAALWQLNKHSDHSFQKRMSNFFCQEQNHCLTFLVHWQPFDNCTAAFVCYTRDHMT